MNKTEIFNYFEDEQAKIEKYLFDNRMNSDPAMIIFNRGIKEYYHGMELVKEYIMRGDVIKNET